jgi:hypothetical protein
MDRIGLEPPDRGGEDVQKIGPIDGEVRIAVALE